MNSLRPDNPRPSQWPPAIFRELGPPSLDGPDGRPSLRRFELTDPFAPEARLLAAAEVDDGAIWMVVRCAAASPTLLSRLLTDLRVAAVNDHASRVVLGPNCGVNAERVALESGGTRIGKLVVMAV